MTIEFHGYLFKAVSDKEHRAYVTVDGVEHNCLPNALKKVAGMTTNGKEYAEVMESFAYQVFEVKTLENDGYFD